MEDTAEDMAQVIYCRCGKLFAASVVPHCYEDADWMKELRVCEAGI